MSSRLLSRLCHLKLNSSASHSDNSHNKQALRKPLLQPETSLRPPGKHELTQLNAAQSEKRTRSAHSSGENDGCKQSSSGDAETNKRKIARARERRATLVLGIVMATFIGCWLPFFFIYPLTLLLDVQVRHTCIGL